MDKFDAAANEIIEEGVLQRVGQRLKNIGRSIKHPVSRTFGSGEEQMQAAITTSRGYKKQKMFRDIISNSVKDLQKLNVLNSDVPTEEIVEFILTSVANQEDYYNFNRDDFSKLGQQFSRNN